MQRSGEHRLLDPLDSSTVLRELHDQARSVGAIGLTLSPTTLLIKSLTVRHSAYQSYRLTDLRFELESATSTTKIRFRAKVSPIYGWNILVLAIPAALLYLAFSKAGLPASLILIPLLWALLVLPNWSFLRFWAEEFCARCESAATATREIDA
jgi:hypothetical protein